MKICSHCRKEIGTDTIVVRKSICPKCSSDLHVCLNCRFYSESAHNKCAEPQAEFQRSRDRANFCDYFIFREAEAASSQDRADALKSLDDLFRK
ncbi:MAG: hypothetical protein HZB31_08660 [Nitrospirae bacterium]|nr:hypothetical protein [Nitrospirota bacterium]